MEVVYIWLEDNLRFVGNDINVVIDLWLNEFYFV